MEKSLKIYNRYRLLGNSGLRVSPLCLGTMSFGNNKNFDTILGSKSSYKEAEEVILKYIELGGNFIDTANLYAYGQSEEVLGKVLEGNKEKIKRDDLVIATKYAFPFKNDPNYAGCHYKSMVRSVNDSLKRLKTDYIDLFYVHFWDYSIDIEEVLRGLNTLVQQGKILHFGFSNVPAWLLAVGQGKCEKNGWPKITASQCKYSLLDRSIENGIIQSTKYLNIGNVVYGALGGGKLSGKYSRQGIKGDVQRTNVKLSEKEFKLLDIVIGMAKKKGKTPVQISFNYLMEKSGMSSILMGCRNVKQLIDTMKSMDFKLDKEEMKKLDEASKEFPGKFYPHNHNPSSPYDNFALTLFLDEKEKYSLERTPQ